MKTQFKKQIDSTKPITQKQLDDIFVKTYFNLDEIQVGDVVLYSLLLNTNQTQNDRLQCTLIQLNEKHFDLFEIYINSNDEHIPTIKLKQRQ